MSSSFKIIASNSATISKGRTFSLIGCLLINLAKAYISAISRLMVWSILGRTTLTTTASPSCVMAVCTWAMEAEASGVRSNCLNKCSVLSPRDCSIMRLASAGSKAGQLSCSLASSSPISSGNKSRLVESVCPNLIKIGPSSSSAKRMRSPRVYCFTGK